MTSSKEMVESAKELHSLGHQVILPDFTHEYATLATAEQMHAESAKNKIEHDLIRGYFETIKTGDAVLIFNIEKNGIQGYIGGNTFLEMGFAFVLNKPIYLLNQIPEVGYKDEIEAMQPIILNGNLANLN